MPSIERVPGGAAFAALSRRVRTLIVGGVLFVVLFVVALTVSVPYVILSPGPTYNTLGVDDAGATVITLDGRAAAPTTGHLNMTTVNVSNRPVSAFQALAGWLLHDEVVVPRAAVYPPGQTQDQVDRQNADDFAASQDNATAAALCELGYPKGFGIFQLVPKGPADGVLEVGDELVSVDGTKVGSTDQLRAALATHQPGERVQVAVRRAGKPATVTVTLGRSPSGAKGGYLGVLAGVTCLAPFTVKITLANIGGPSAGLMFALGIIDKAGKQDLTGGRFIAGTGTIDPTGKVGPIGGIALKMIAARDKGATVFLAPKDNCGDVRGNVPSGLQIVAVSSLHDALTDLAELRSGRGTPPTC
ncbi:MAG: YlbL family protein [Jatrophihabitans sp.]|uniref:YlbL family protein n=1 Tax=Jatrophihabitans sp. TaxID=1932789 RepID=UPI003F7DD2DA